MKFKHIQAQIFFLLNHKKPCLYNELYFGVPPYQWEIHPVDVMFPSSSLHGAQIINKFIHTVYVIVTAFHYLNVVLSKTWGVPCKTRIALLTFKTSVGLAMVEDTTPERMPHTTFTSRVSSINEHKLFNFSYAQSSSYHSPKYRCNSLTHHLYLSREEWTFCFRNKTIFLSRFFFFFF